MRFAAFFLVLLLLGVTAGAATMQTTNEDDRIFDEVSRRLAMDRDIKGNSFEIDVKQGIVTIKGFVSKDSHRGRAERIAKRVKGVKGVVNQLAIKEY